MINMKIICSCGKILSEYEEGVNGSDYYECECGLCYNVIHSKYLDEDDEEEEED